MKLLLWTLGALAGVVLAAGVTYAASSLSTQRIGISSEPVSAGQELAPKAPAIRTATPTPTPRKKAKPKSTATPPPVVTPVPTAAPTVDDHGGGSGGSGKGRGGGGHGSDD
jgi:septal ring-binding cell division protein DamX